MGGMRMHHKNKRQPLPELAPLSRKVAAEGAVLLKNDDQVLPLVENDHVAIFGRTQINYYRSGTGSGGSVHVEYTTNLLDSLRKKSTIIVNENLAKVYEDWIKENPFDNGGGGWASEPWHQKEMELTDTIVKNARKESNKAIIVIGRTAGEDKDNLIEPGSYLLTNEEKQMIRKVTDYFENTIVLLNVSNIIDMSWLEDDYKYPIKGCIYAWHGGMEGGNAIADVLVGDVTPSGKLPDTIAYSIDDYPSTVNYGNTDKNYYAEDIYVGYRFFETFKPDRVLFEFGFGLSYTTFSYDLLSTKIIPEQDDKIIQIDIKVTNTGQYPGREVIQVYYEAPQGLLGKPRRELVTFSKTRTLQPSEEEIITLTFKQSQMASYDDSGVTGYPYAYVLEKGLYHVFVGTSVRKIKTVEFNGKPGIEITETMVIEQLQQALAPTEAFNRYKPGEALSDGTYELLKEPVPQRRYDLKERIMKQLPNSINYTGDNGYTLKDVYNNKIDLKTFVAQLSEDDLAAISRGEGMNSPWVTPGTAAAFGGITDKLFSLGIPIACCADGPSGIRMDSGQKATQVPIGTLIASTWDLPLIEELYYLVGQEMLNYEIDVLLGPGMNIHRNPLNGRNFEYFSEDPLITGKFATAVTKGLRKSGVHATLKHFACNNQEIARHRVDAVVSERALREIYLKGFEIVVKEGGAQAIMTAYNPINGYWAASNYDLTTTILRHEWNYEGIVMTDWWAMMNDVIEGGEPDKRLTDSMIRAQNDLYMVVPNLGAEVNIENDNTIESLKNSTLTIGELQRNAMNICRFLMTTPAFHRTQELKEKVIQLHPLTDLIDQFFDLSRDSKIYVDGKEELYFKVVESGHYRLFVEVMSPQQRLEQIATNILINDEYVTTVQIHGTEGHWKKLKLSKLYLEEGFYKINLIDTLPGLVFKSILLNYID